MLPPPPIYVGYNGPWSPQNNWATSRFSLWVSHIPTYRDKSVNDIKLSEGFKNLPSDCSFGLTSFSGEVRESFGMNRVFFCFVVHRAKQHWLYLTFCCALLVNWLIENNDTFPWPANTAKFCSLEEKKCLQYIVVTVNVTAWHKLSMVFLVYKEQRGKNIQIQLVCLLLSSIYQIFSQVYLMKSIIK